METLTLISGIVAFAVQAAPVAKTVYDDAAKIVQSLADKGLISKEQQQGFHDWADVHQAAVLAKQVPPEFVVVPDPAPGKFGGSASELPHNA